MRRIGIAVLIAACTGTVVGQMPDDVETGDHVVGEGVYERASRSGSIAEWEAVTGIGLGGLDEWETAALGDRWAASLGRVVEAEWERSVARFDAAGLRRAIDAANRRYLYETDGGGEYTFDEAGDVILQGAEGYEAAEAAWEAEVEDAFAALYTAWEASAEATATEVLGTFEGAVRETVASELAVSVGEYKAHIEREFRSQVIRSSRRLAQGRLQDSYSMRRQAEEETARSTAGRLIRDTQVRLDEVSAHLAALVPEGDADVGEARIEAEAWQESFEAEFARGLSAWNGAEERFIAERMAWESEAQEQYREAEAAWDEALRSFEASRSAWIGEMQDVLAVGAAAWEETTTAFRDSFDETMAELARAAAEEQAKIRSESEAYLAVYRQAADVVAMAKENIAALEGMKETLEADQAEYLLQRNADQAALPPARYAAFLNGGHESNMNLVQTFLAADGLDPKLLERQTREVEGAEDSRTITERSSDRDRRLQGYVNERTARWVPWLQNHLGITHHDHESPMARLTMEIALANNQLSSIAASLAEVNEELVYWHGADGTGGVLADFEAMRDGAQASLYGMFGELDTYGAALSSGEVEAARLAGMVAALEDQHAIAEAVAAYAADTSSDRATLAETEARYAVERAAFEAAEAAFAEAIATLETMTRTLLPDAQAALADRQAALSIEEAELRRITAELAAAEEVQRLNDASVYDTLIRTLSDHVTTHAGEGRAANAEAYARADADAHVATAWEDALSIAHDLAGSDDAESDEYVDLPTLIAHRDVLAGLAIDWATVDAEELGLTLAAAGLDIETGRYADLVAAIDAATAVGAGTPERRLRELAAERLLADATAAAARDVARSEYAIRVLRGTVVTDEAGWASTDEIAVIGDGHAMAVTTAHTALDAAREAARDAIQGHYDTLVAAEAVAIEAARDTAVTSAYAAAVTAAVDAGLSAPTEPTVVTVADASEIPANPAIGTVYILTDDTGAGTPPPGVAYVVFDPALVTIDMDALLDGSDAAGAARIVFETGERDTDFGVDYAGLVDDLLRDEVTALADAEALRDAWEAYREVSITTIGTRMAAYAATVTAIVAPITADGAPPSIATLRDIYEELVAMDDIPTAVADLVTVYTRARIAELGGSVSFVGPLENRERAEVLAAALEVLEDPDASAEDRDAAAAAVGGSADDAGVGALRSEYEHLTKANAGAAWLRHLVDEAGDTSYHTLTGGTITGGIASAPIKGLIGAAIAALTTSSRDEIVELVTDGAAGSARSGARTTFLGAESTYLGTLGDLDAARATQADFEADADRFARDTIAPLKEDIKTQRGRVDDARREYEEAIRAFDEAVTDYEAAASGVDTARGAYTAARRELQEAEEIMDYARTGYLTDEIDPAAVVLRRSEELERARTVLRLVEEHAERVTDASRDQRYGDLIAEERAAMLTYQEAAVVRETLAVKTSGAEGALAASQMEVARTAGQLARGDDFTFAPDYDAVGTGRIAGDQERFHAASYFSGDWEETFSTDLASWALAMNQLGGDALRTMGLALYYEIHFTDAFADADHNVVEATILNDASFNNLLDKISLNMDEYVDWQTGVLTYEGTVRWKLERETRAAYDQIRSAGLSHGAYRFFTMLVAGDGPVDEAFSVDFIADDASKVVRDYVDPKAESKQRSYLRWWRTVRRRKGKRIRTLRRQIPDYAWDDQRVTLMELVGGVTTALDDQNTKAAELRVLAGKRPTAAEVRTSLTASGTGAISAELSAMIAEVVSGGSASERATSLSVLAAAETRLASDVHTAGTAVADRIAELATAQQNDQLSYETVLGRYLRGEEVTEAELETVTRTRFADPAYDIADHMAYRQGSMESVLIRHGTTGAPTGALATFNDEARAFQLELIAEHIHDAAGMRLGGVHTAQSHRLTMEYETLMRREDDWTVRMNSLVATGLTEWQAGSVRLAGQRKRFQEETQEAYAEAVAVWNARYDRMTQSRTEWIERTTQHAVRAGSEATARQVGLDAERLIAESEAIAVPDLDLEVGNLEHTVREATDGRMLSTIVREAGRIADRAGGSPIVAAYLPRVRSTTQSARSARALSDELGEEIQRRAMRVTALQMREQIREGVVAVTDGINDANRAVEGSLQTTMERGGYRRQGMEWQRRVIIDETLMGGIERETQTAGTYDDFTAPVFAPQVDLSEESLDGLSSRGIQTMIAAAYEEMERYQILIFGRSDDQKDDGTAATSVEELNGELKERFAAVEASWTHAAGYDRTRENEESGEEEYLHHDTEGLFNFHVGYAPVMKSDDPERVQEAGYGEMGRIMEDFYRNEARLGRGLAMMDVPFHRMRLWDDDADNDGSPDGLFGAPNIVTVTGVVVSVATLGAGAGVSLAATIATNAAFTVTDIATGYADADDALGSFAKSTAVSLASAGMAKGFDQLGTLADKAVDGSRAITQTAVNVGVSTTQAVATTAMSSAINSFSIDASFDMDFDERGFRRSTFGESAVAGYAGGAAQGLANGMVGNFLTSDGIGDALAENTFNLDALRSAATITSSAIGAATEYAIDGSASLNVVNMGRMLGITDEKGNELSAGVLQMDLGGGGALFNVGSGGYDVGLDLVATSLEGLSDVVRVTSAKVGGALGTQRGVENRAILNAANTLSYSRDRRDTALAGAVWERRIKSEFDDMAEGEYGRYDSDNPDTIVLSRALTGNDRESSAMLGSAMAHEATHLVERAVLGETTEASAYNRTLQTYERLKDVFGLEGDADFSQAIEDALRNPENYLPNRGPVDYFSRHRDGRITWNGERALRDADTGRVIDVAVDETGHQLGYSESLLEYVGEGNAVAHLVAAGYPAEEVMNMTDADMAYALMTSSGAEWNGQEYVTSAGNPRSLEESLVFQESDRITEQVAERDAIDGLLNAYEELVVNGDYQMANAVWSDVQQRMGTYNEQYLLPSMGVTPEAEITQGFRTERQMIDIQGPARLDYAHPAIDTAGGIGVFAPGYAQVIPGADATDGILLSVLGTSYADRILHMNPDDLVGHAIGDIIGAGEQIAPFPTSLHGTGSGAHAHHERIWNHPEHGPGFTNPQTGEGWFDGSQFPGTRYDPVYDDGGNITGWEINLFRSWRHWSARPWEH